MTLYFHVRKEDLHEGSASDRNPAFASFDVVHRCDYEALSLALEALLEHAERIQEHVPKSEGWYAVRDCARVALSKIGGGSSASDAATLDSGALRTVPTPDYPVPGLAYRYLCPHDAGAGSR